MRGSLKSGGILLFFLLCLLFYYLATDIIPIPYVKVGIINWAREQLMIYVPMAFFALLIAGLYPNGLRQVGWKREGWGIQILLGVAIFVGIWLVSYGSYLVGRVFLPGWVAQMSPFIPPFQGFLHHTLLEHLAGFFFLFLQSVEENTFSIFLFVRLRECFRGRLWIPFIVVLIVDAIGHFEFGFPRSLGAIMDKFSITAIQFTWLIIFYRTRHIGAVVISHTLYNFSLDVHRWIAGGLEWILTGGG